MSVNIEPGLKLALPLWESQGSPMVSADAYGHAATVTGAVWRPQGHYFDGIDDKVTVPPHEAIDWGRVFSLAIWFKIVTWTDYRRLLQIEADTNNKILIYLDAGGFVQFTIRESSVYGVFLKPADDITAVGTWYHWVVTVDEDAQQAHLYQNGLRQSSDYSFTLPDLSGTNLNLGGEGFTNCMIGDFSQYARVLTPPEVERLYLETKWRYR